MAAAAPEIRHRQVEANGITMHVAEAGPASAAALAVLFVHGFPELCFGQLIPWTCLHKHHIGLQEPGYEAQFASLDLKRFFKMAITVETTGSSAMSLQKMQSSNKQITLPSWLSEEDVSYLASVYAKTGFAGGLNYYRCLDLNWELMAPWTGAKVQVPTKFIVGDGDLAYHHPGVKGYIHKGGLKRDVPMLDEVVVIKGAGHFIQQERAQEISEHIYEYIKKFSTDPTRELSKL
uniref:AB hydrolase-1 domain-containing protein n=1 Tax=Aegilops tauschii TaxID=37682 RepID=M8BV72_AEGTA